MTTNVWKATKALKVIVLFETVFTLLLFLTVFLEHLKRIINCEPEYDYFNISITAVPELCSALLLKGIKRHKLNREASSK